MKPIRLTILCIALLGNVACTSLGLRMSDAESPRPLTAEQVKTVAHAAAAIHWPVKVHSRVDNPIMKTGIRNIVPNLPARARGASIGDVFPNRQQILAVWDYYYWLNDNATLVVTAEQRHTGIVITGTAVKSGRMH